MTRMWLINPKKLCDKHLKGEHGELHQLVGTIKNHPYGEAVVKGHIRENNIDLDKVVSRHEELVEEIERRDLMNHQSSLEQLEHDFDNTGSVIISSNIKTLKNRCLSCKKRIRDFRSEDECRTDVCNREPVPDSNYCYICEDTLEEQRRLNNPMEA